MKWKLLKVESENNSKKISTHNLLEKKLIKNLKNNSVLPPYNPGPRTIHKEYHKQIWKEIQTPIQD